MPRRLALLTVVVFGCLPAVAQAAPFNDRVGDASPRPDRLSATTAQATGTLALPTAEGYSVSVSFADGVTPDATLAASYVAYLDSIPHGPELAKLHVLIADPSTVSSLCGGQEGDGVLACYGPADAQMIVPSSGLDAPSEGPYTVRYVLTHEYGHHIAANRANDEFTGGALDSGPKFWASRELVCNNTLDGHLFPGNEDVNYLRNPGEAWAETYARLVFPQQPWTWTSLLRPDAAALDAARRDVLAPWTKNTARTFRMKAARDREAFRVPLTLDGKLSATISGPKGSQVNIMVTSGRQTIGASKRSGSRDRWTLATGCRERPSETLSFTATRKGGQRGPVTMRVSYPG
jgi:hypothetical protein